MAENAPKVSEKRWTDRARSRSFSSRYSRRRPSWAMTLNLTSMVDLVFLLLFFFLAATRFTRPEGTLPADLPGQQAAAANIEIPRTPISIRLAPAPGDAPGCRLTVDRFHPEPLPLADLAPALERIRNEVPGFDGRTPVHLVADDTVPWDSVVNAYNAALFAGFERIYFVGTTR